MDNRAYWIFLQQAFGAGSRKPMLINRQYSQGVKEFCMGGPRLWSLRRDITDREAASLSEFTLSQAEARLEYALKMDWKVLTPDDRKYPELLKNIPDPPAVLYVKGELPDFETSLTIGVAGARKATDDSINAAKRFGYELALGGAWVVSGEAKGVDFSVLSGAVSVPGAKCISVLPVSLDSQYLPGSSKLRRVIVERGGALVSEYFSADHPEFGAFQARNRIITGLSRGVVLIQAALKSGTMIYASQALEQNRDVFVYPGPGGRPASGAPEFAGSLSLIEDGAKAVNSGEEVINEYDSVMTRQINSVYEELFDMEIEDDELPFVPEKHVTRTVPARQKAAPVLRDAASDAVADLSENEKAVYTVLSVSPIPVGDIAQRSGVPVGKLLGILTNLELKGLVTSHPGKRYSRG